MNIEVSMIEVCFVFGVLKERGSGGIHTFLYPPISHFSRQYQEGRYIHEPTPSCVSETPPAKEKPRIETPIFQSPSSPKSHSHSCTNQTKNSLTKTPHRPPAQTQSTSPTPPPTPHPARAPSSVPGGKHPKPSKPKSSPLYPRRKVRPPP